jgi:hypothetical protein
VLLASDGMFKTLSIEEIRACLAGDPQRWAEVLVAQTLAHKREYQDNVTVVSVTASDALVQTIPPNAGVKALGNLVAKTVALPAVAPPMSPPIPPPPPPPKPAVVSKPAVAIEWPSGEHAVVPTPPSRSSPWWLLVVLLVIVAAGAAGWWYQKHIRANKPAGAASPESRKAEDLPALRSDPPANPVPTGAPAQPNPQDQNPDTPPPGDPDDGPPPPGMPGGAPAMRRAPAGRGAPIEPGRGVPMQPLSEPVRKPNQ